MLTQARIQQRTADQARLVSRAGGEARSQSGVDPLLSFSAALSVDAKADAARAQVSGAMAFSQPSGDRPPGEAAAAAHAIAERISAELAAAAGLHEHAAAAPGSAAGQPLTEVVAPRREKRELEETAAAPLAGANAPPAAGAPAVAAPAPAAQPAPDVAMLPPPAADGFVVQLGPGDLVVGAGLSIDSSAEERAQAAAEAQDALVEKLAAQARGRLLKGSSR